MKPTEKQLIQLYEIGGRTGVVELVRRFLSEHNSRSSDVLFLMQWCDHIPLLEAVLEANPDVNVTNSVGATPLYYAAAVGFRDLEECQRRVCELLIDKGADVNRRHRIRFEAPPRVLDGDTALMTAARTNATSIVELLLAKGADPFLKDGGGLRALEHAVRRGSKEAASILKRAESGRREK
jgi:hypothetical protein